MSKHFLSEEEVQQLLMKNKEKDVLIPTTIEEMKEDSLKSFLNFVGFTEDEIKTIMRKNLCEEEITKIESMFLNKDLKELPLPQNRHDFVLIKNYMILEDCEIILNTILQKIKSNQEIDMFQIYEENNLKNCASVIQIQN